MQSFETNPKTASPRFSSGAAMPLLSETPPTQFVNAPTIHRKSACACGGGCPACEEDKLIQTKLTVGEPDDEYEREADSIADHVMNMDAGTAVSGALGGPTVQLKTLPISRINKPLKLQRQTLEEEQSEKEDGEDEIIQTKLMASASDPPEENKRGRKAPSIGAFSLGYIQRRIDEEEEEQQISLKKDKAGSNESPDRADVMAGVESAIRQKSGSGAMLPDETRNFMEDRFGVDFSNVRIHTDSDSARLNRTLNSLAFTTGQDVYFTPGMYRPGTNSGDRLLAHELTHVVQQTGGSQLRRAMPKNGMYIQRSDTESKTYTQDTATLYGSVAHKTIEKLLEAADKSLITEAPIPGATSGTQELNLVGFADLYKSTDSVVAGVRGKNKVPEGSPTGERELAFENMPTPATSKAIGGAFGRLSSSGTIKHGPKRGKKVKATGEIPWDVTPDFPENFWIGDIKPLRMPVGRGETKAEFQIRNYIEGFQKFVAAANKGSGGKTRGSTTGAVLNLSLPASLDYAQFDTEHTKTVGEDHKIKKRGTKDKERIWVYQPSAHPGVYYYFSIPDPYAPADYPKEIERILLGLDPLLLELREKHPKIPGKIATKRIDGKKAESTEGREPQQDKAKKTLPKPTGRELIQRSPTPAADKDRWKKKSVAWQTSHGTWDKGDKGASKFIEGTARGPVVRAEIDKELNIPAGIGRSVIDEPDKLKKINLWSGKSGLALGKLRFYFGDLFDRLMRFFEKIKEKFEKWHKGADKLKPKGRLTKGWVGTAVTQILKFGAMILKQTLQFGYSAFSACVNGMFDKIIDRFTDDLNEKLHEELNPVAEKIGEMNEKLREEFAAYEGPINMVVDNVDQIQQWTTILSALETGIRIGVQVVSCGTPPGLGCLWGLVAQLAIGEALELLSETDYFEDHIAKPTANKLMQHFIGNKFQNLVAGTVETLGLGSYAEGVAECARVSDTSGGGSGFGFFGAPGAFDPNAPDVVKARQAWEAKYHDKMMADLLKVFAHTPEKGKKPVPATKEDIEKLVEALKKANLDPEALRALVQGSKQKGGKKVKIDEFLSQLEKVPSAPSRTVTADTTGIGQQPASAGDTPPPTIGKGEKPQQDKTDEAGKGGQTPGTDPAKDKQQDGNPLFDANKLPKLSDDKGMVENPNVIFTIEAKADHQQGKIYDVMVHVFEYGWSTTLTYDPRSGKSISSEPERKPLHIYSVANVKALVLEKKPGLAKGGVKEDYLTYRILENIEVMYQAYPDAEIDQHIIPKKNATSVIKTGKTSGK